MTVYIITTETFPNGLAATERIKCYAKALASNYSCEVLCVNRHEDPTNPRGNIKASGKIGNYSYRYLGNSTFKPQGNLRTILAKVHDVSKLSFELLGLHKNDVVIYYSYNIILMKLVLLLSKIKGFKVYYEINEHPSIQLGGFKMVDSSQTDLRKLYHMIKDFDGIFCISSAIRNLLLKTGIPTDKLHIVNMIVDTNRFKNIEKEEVEPYLAYCGAADNNKDGVDQLIKSFSIIANKYVDLKLYIIGPKTENSTNEVLVESLGLSDRVVFTGLLSPQDMPQLLLNAKGLVLDRPNSLQAKYGFPTKLGEYLLTGNPVVVTAVGDIPLFLEDGVNAYLAKADDVLSFSSKLDELLSDSIRATKIGSTGRQVALNCFSDFVVSRQISKALNS